MNIELDRIYNMDCLDGMRQMEAESVDLTVTSPPYDNLRTYNGYCFDFENIARELYRVTKHGGVVVVPIGRHGGGIRLLGGGTFNGDFTTFAECILIILTAARNHIPIGTISDTIRIGVGHVR